MPDPGDTKAGDRGQGTSSSGGLKGGGGNTSGVGGGGGGGGGSTGSRGSSTGGVGAGNGSNAPGNAGGGGQGGQNSGMRGAGSNTGPGSGRPGSSLGGGSKGPGGPNGPNSGPSRGAGGQGGQTVAGGKTDRLGGGNTSKVGGPGAGGMGAENVRNGSSLGNVGALSGYSAPGNVGAGRNPATGQMQQGVSSATARADDRYQGVKTQMDSYNARNPMMDMSQPTPRAMAEQYSQYRAPPGATPRAPGMVRDDRAPSVTPDGYRAPTDVSRIGQEIEAVRGMNAIGMSAAAATGRPTAQPMQTSDLWGDDNVPLDPSIAGRAQAAQRPSDIDYNTFNLRGLTGPYGEPRRQPTSYGTNYQTAQMARAMYPNSIGRYDQTTVTEALEKIAGALPGEAHYAKYGEVANYMNNLAKVSLNQMVGGMSPSTAAGNLDTTGMTKRTAGFDQPGPHSAGMTENWANKEKGAAYQSQASQSIQDALFGRGVSPVAMNASNFVAAGTNMVPGVTPVGSPVNGTQFGDDTTWGNRIENRNTKAMASLETRGPDLSSFRGDVQPASYEEDDTPTRASSNIGTRSAISGGLGIQGYGDASIEGDGVRVESVSPARTNTVPDWRQSTYTGRQPTEVNIYGGPAQTNNAISGGLGMQGYGNVFSPGTGQNFGPPMNSDGTINRADLDKWYGGGPSMSPADDEERILEVENVPPEYISPTTQMPPPKLPVTPRAWTAAEKLPYVGPFVKGLRTLGSWEYDHLSEQERADLMQKWAEQNASYGRYGDSLGGSKQEPLRPSDLFGNGNNAYVPVGAGDPPPDDTPEDPNDPNDPWGGRTRVGNPADPWNYGYGPGFNYFTYA